MLTLGKFGTSFSDSLEAIEKKSILNRLKLFVSFVSESKNAKKR